MEGLWLVALVIFEMALSVQSQLRTGFYSTSCLRAEAIVRSTVESYFRKDPTIAAGLLRLHFHDCFVQGCDGSVLIAGSSAERNALPNLGLRGFEVIDDAKSQIEAFCPGVVSCADILALAARDAVGLSDGPSWSVPTGRRDGRVSLSSQASNLPSPLDSVAAQKQKFSDKGLDDQDLVTLVGIILFFPILSSFAALENKSISLIDLGELQVRKKKRIFDLCYVLVDVSGAHTIGQTHCQIIRYRLYNFTATGNADPTINQSFLSQLQAVCPKNGDGTKPVPLDKDSQTDFDTRFFKNVRDGNGVLESDQRLWDDAATRDVVKKYAGTIRGLFGLRFDSEFRQAMVKMSSIEVKTGTDGEIRKVCSKFN